MEQTELLLLSRDGSLPSQGPRGGNPLGAAGVGLARYKKLVLCAVRLPDQSFMRPIQLNIRRAVQYLDNPKRA